MFISTFITLLKSNIVSVILFNAPELKWTNNKQVVFLLMLTKINSVILV